MSNSDIGAKSPVKAIDEFLPKRAHLSPAEVAKFLGVSLSEVYGMLADGALPVIHIGCLLKIPRDRFERWYVAQLDGDENNA